MCHKNAFAASTDAGLHKPLGPIYFIAHRLSRFRIGATYHWGLAIKVVIRVDKH